MPCAFSCHQLTKIWDEVTKPQEISLMKLDEPLNRVKTVQFKQCQVPKYLGEKPLSVRNLIWFGLVWFHIEWEIDWALGGPTPRRRMFSPRWPIFCPFIRLGLGGPIKQTVKCHLKFIHTAFLNFLTDNIVLERAWCVSIVQITSFLDFQLI